MCAIDRPVRPVRLVVYSDYLCPWCHVASFRLRRLEDDLAGALELDWRPYLLRPAPRADRDLEKFRRYTEGWRRPAAEADAPPFRVWTGDAGPPTDSLPPHVVTATAMDASASFTP